jgi:hypothetical protein
LAIWISERGARIVISPLAHAAAAPDAAGQMMPRFMALAAIAAGSTPATGETVPSSASSPSAT